jgi:GH24 family phage-related lysozyme (muramidase)
MTAEEIKRSYAMGLLKQAADAPSVGAHTLLKQEGYAEDKSSAKGWKPTWDPVGKVWTQPFGLTGGAAPKSGSLMDHADEAVAVYDSGAKEVAKLLPGVELDSTREAGLKNMLYNMGPKRLATFTDMRDALEAGDFEAAGAEASDSLYAKQVGPARAGVVANMIEDGDNAEVVDQLWFDNQRPRQTIIDESKVPDRTPAKPAPKQVAEPVVKPAPAKRKFVPLTTGITKQNSQAESTHEKSMSKQAYEIGFKSGYMAKSASGSVGSDEREREHEAAMLRDMEGSASALDALAASGAIEREFPERGAPRPPIETRSPDYHEKYVVQDPARLFLSGTYGEAAERERSRAKGYAERAGIPFNLDAFKEPFTFRYEPGGRTGWALTGGNGGGSLILGRGMDPRLGISPFGDADEYRQRADAALTTNGVRPGDGTDWLKLLRHEFTHKYTVGRNGQEYKDDVGARSESRPAATGKSGRIVEDMSSDPDKADAYPYTNPMELEPAVQALNAWSYGAKGSRLLDDSSGQDRPLSRDALRLRLPPYGPDVTDDAFEGQLRDSGMDTEAKRAMRYLRLYKSRPDKESWLLDQYRRLAPALVDAGPGGQIGKQAGFEAGYLGKQAGRPARSGGACLLKAAASAEKQFGRLAIHPEEASPGIRRKLAYLPLGTGFAGALAGGWAGGALAEGSGPATHAAARMGGVMAGALVGAMAGMLIGMSTLTPGEGAAVASARRQGRSGFPA